MSTVGIIASGQSSPKNEDKKNGKKSGSKRVSKVSTPTMPFCKANPSNIELSDNEWKKQRIKDSNPTILHLCNCACPVTSSDIADLKKLIKLEDVSARYLLCPPPHVRTTIRELVKEEAREIMASFSTFT